MKNRIYQLSQVILFPSSAEFLFEEDHFLEEVCLHVDLYPRTETSVVEANISARISINREITDEVRKYIYLGEEENRNRSETLSNLLLKRLHILKYLNLQGG